MRPMLLPAPTPETVLDAEREFDNEYALTESALTQLFELYPRNTHGPTVLLKVVALNQLYNTNVFAVESLARHIVEVDIDALLAERSPVVVDRIAKLTVGDKTRNHYSFASKYCSWHHPESYPIYDSRVEACLWAYRKQDKFCEFRREELWVYEGLLRIVDTFRSHYGLGSFTYKQLDKFLYKYGAPVTRAASPSV